MPQFRVTVDIDVDNVGTFGKAQEYVQKVLGLGWNAIKSEEEKIGVADHAQPNMSYFNTRKIRRL